MREEFVGAVLRRRVMRLSEVALFVSVSCASGRLHSDILASVVQKYNIGGRVRRSIEDARTSPIARRVVRERLTYLSFARIRNIERCIQYVNRRRVPGDFLEAGVALGGSAIIMASQMGSERSFHGYDLFGQIPPPSEADDASAHERYKVITSGKSSGIGSDEYYGYADDLYGQVVGAFRRHGLQVDGSRIALHKGLFQDTLRVSTSVALAHLDCDWYESVQVCLDRVGPKLAERGYLIIDDYNNYAGCAKAVDEYLASHAELQWVTADSNIVLQRRAGEA
jgi:O-methyltransferase